MSVSSALVSQKQCIRFQVFKPGDTALPHLGSLWEWQGPLDSNKGRSCVSEDQWRLEATGTSRA